MRIQITTLGVLICLAVVAPGARADDRSDIQALFHRLARSLSAKDSGAVMAVGTQDLVFVEKGRTLSGSQIARHLQQRFRLMQGSPHCTFSIISLSVKGKGASVLTNDYTEAEVGGASGRTHKVVASGQSRDELVKSKNGWLLKSVYVLTDNMTMDGKSISTSALGGMK